MNNVVIIGAGQLGSRHLQGLAKITIPVEIFVVDPSETSLATAKERYHQIPANKNIKKIEFFTELGKLPKNVDLVIIATTANIRAKITKELLSKVQVNSIVFEKVVFQNINDFAEIDKLLTKNKVMSWVNCPRRAYKIYQQLHEIFNGKQILYTLSGGEWGLGCNAIHFLDSIAYLTGEMDYSLNTDSLDPGFIVSKRPGFLEFTGTLQGRFNNGSQFVLQALRGSAAPHIITITSAEAQVILDENKLQVWLARSADKWAREQQNFSLPYQSELTNVIAQDILKNNSAQLPTFSESYKLHKVFLTALLKHLCLAGMNVDSCPIT